MREEESNIGLSYTIWTSDINELDAIAKLSKV